ncbi:MAG: hypothetical protein FWH46_03440 [Methanimicrococcus sp.]|nr:hypothetical protein [Methanimicrococcus sp.]
MCQNIEDREKKLVFIYSLDGLIEYKIALFIQRFINPSKIECPLYSIIYDQKGLKPEFTEAMKRIELDIPYELLYRNDFIKKYDCFEIFGKFHVSDVTYPSIYIIIGHEKEEREIYELVPTEDILKCSDIADLNRILSEKYDQFKTIGPEEFKKMDCRKV